MRGSANRALRAVVTQKVFRFIRDLRTRGRGVRFQNKGECFDLRVSLGLADSGVLKGPLTEMAT